MNSKALSRSDCNVLSCYLNSFFHSNEYFDTICLLVSCLVHKRLDGSACRYSAHCFKSLHIPPSRKLLLPLCSLSQLGRQSLPEATRLLRQDQLGHF